MSCLLFLLLCVSSLMGFTKCSPVASARNSSNLVVTEGRNQTTIALIPHNILAVVNHLTVVNKQLSDILTNHGVQTKTAWPRGCASKISKRLDTEKKLAIWNFQYCNVMNIFTNVVIVMVDTFRFFFEVSVDVTLIIAEVVACSSSFNPFVVIKCIVTGLTVVPEEVRELFAIAGDYKDLVEYMVPKILLDIEYCFSKTVGDYDKVIKNTLNNAKICSA